MNPFESGERKIVPAVLIYARSANRVLMIHRNAPDRPGDYHAGKWNGLGGKLEADESPLEGARRELREESGIEASVEAFRALGVLQFPSFKAHKNEDWLVWVFEVRLGRVVPDLGPCAEGQLHWVAEERLLELNLWPGDRHFLPSVLQSRGFVGTLWYVGQDLNRFWFQDLGPCN